MEKLLGEKEVEKIKRFLRGKKSHHPVDLRGKKGGDFEYNLFEPCEGIEEEISVTCVEREETAESGGRVIGYELTISVSKKEKESKEIVYQLHSGLPVRINPRKKIFISDLKIEGDCSSKSGNIFELFLENVNIDKIYLKQKGFLHNSLPHDNKVESLLGRMMLSFKNVKVCHIAVDPDTVADNPELLNGGKVLVWRVLLKEIHTLEVEGDVRFDSNENINYKILELFYGHFSKTEKIRSTEYVYKSLLGSYKKLEDTSSTNKFVINIRSLISEHRTSIKNPLQGIGIIAAILLLLSCILDCNLVPLLIPGSVLRGDVSDVVLSISSPQWWKPLVSLLVWLQQIVTVVLYYEVISIFKKFARKK